MPPDVGVIVTARSGGVLVGVSRAITDYSYCTYLSDMAVDASFKRCGIGRELIRRSHDAAGLHTTLILLAAPAARSYYPAHRDAAVRLLLDSAAVGVSPGTCVPGLSGSLAISRKTSTCRRDCRFG